MPRQQSLQIQTDSPFESHGIQVGTQIIAHPVDTYSSPGVDQQMQQLGHFLENGKQFLSEVQEDDAKEGARDAALGKDMKKTVLGSYEKGWLGVRGTVNAAEDFSKVKSAFESGFDRNAPGGLEGWLGGKYKELASGVDPNSAYGKAYSAKLAEGFDQLRALHYKEQSDSVVAQSEADYITMLHGAIRGKGGAVITPDDFANVTKTLSDNGVGFDPKRKDDLGKKALLALAGEGNIQAITAAKKAGKDGTKPFPTITDDEFQQLEAHAQTVFIQAESRRHALLKQQYEERVNNALYPVIKQAATGDMAGAQKAFDKLAQSDLFLSHPEDFDKFQKMLVSTSDRAMTVEQRETFNHLYEGIWTGKVGVNDIIRQGLPQKDTMNLTTVWMDKWKVDRAAASADRQADAMNNLFKNQSVMADIRSGLESLPRLEGFAATMDAETDGGRKSQKLREIRADLQSQLYRAAAESGGDIEKFDKQRAAILNRGSDHAQAVIGSDAKGSVMDKPAFIHHSSWAEYREAIRRGEVPADPQTLEATRKWFMRQRKYQQISERASHYIP